MTISYKEHSLDNAQILRYSRQLLIPEVGVKGQEKLINARVLIVGAGGLGCPVATYLCAAGVGCLGIVDYDDICLDNLHRQVLHAEADIGTSKTASVERALKRLDKRVTIRQYNAQLDVDNVLEICKDYNVVVDCSDNAPTRYLVNDACVALNKPLVSGSALKWEGHLTVYNCGEDCPCYRCLYPKPPPPSAMTNCSEGGVIGPVVGMIGSMQAMETLKIIMNIDVAYAGRMFVHDALRGETRTIMLRRRQVESCIVCKQRPDVTWPVTNYTMFCGVQACDKLQCIRVLDDKERWTVEKLSQAIGNECKDTVVVDCRPPHEFNIAHLPGSKNLPLTSLSKMQRVEEINVRQEIDAAKNVIFVCHRGNDSQLAAIELRRLLKDAKSSLTITDVVGGLERYSKVVDNDFPVY